MKEIRSKLRRIIYYTEKNITNILRKEKYFRFNKKRYKYYYHTYNCTWRNERIVEIPIFVDIITQSPKKMILEVGNVLSHYIHTYHDIIDKYEKGNGVINKDIVDFNTKKKYDLILSISTFEHIGWDEKDHEPKKVKQAIKKIKELLKKGGKAYITIPFGYNKYLDKSIEEEKIKFSQIFYLKRKTRDNQWMQISREEIRDSTYAKPFPGTNVLIIVIIKKE